MSTFAKTCNRLSLFLKEKGNLIDFGINANFDDIGKPEEAITTTTTIRTVDLLSKMETPIEKSTKSEESTSTLPQYTTVDSFLDNSTNETASSKPIESKTEQMTIFYRGQVLVFDSVSADKARGLMIAAINASHDKKIQNRVRLDSYSFGSQHVIEGLQENGSDLPIARRISLHKFLEKRKERATGRAPYQLHNPSSTAAASLNHKFDLNL